MTTKKGSPVAEPAFCYRLSVSLPCFHLACLVCVSSDCSTAHKMLSASSMKMNMYVRVENSFFRVQQTASILMYLCAMLSVPGWEEEKKSQIRSPSFCYLSFSLPRYLLDSCLHKRSFPKKKCCADEFLILTLILRRDGLSPQALLPMSFRSRRQNSRLYGLIDSLREVFASSDDASPFTLARRVLGTVFDGNVGKRRCATRLAARFEAKKVKTLC